MTCILSCFECGMGIESDDKEGLDDADLDKLICGRCVKNPLWYMRDVPVEYRLTLVKPDESLP